MSLTQLKTIPTSLTRLGSVCFDKLGTSTNTAYFITESANDANLPEMGTSDFLIFGELDFRTSSATYHWGLGSSSTGRYITVSVNGSTGAVTFSYAYSNTQYLSATQTATPTTGGSRYNGRIKYFVWRSYNATGTSDWFGVGVLGEDGTVYTAEIDRDSTAGGGADITSAQSAWTINNSTGMLGTAGYMVFGGRYYNSTVEASAGGVFGPVTFCKFANISDGTGLGYNHSDLTTFKNNLKAMVADPAAYLASMATPPTKVWSIGDIKRYGSRLQNRTRTPALLDTDSGTPGDRLVCTRTGLSLKLLAADGVAVYHPPYTPPCAYPGQPTQYTSGPQAQRFGDGYILSRTDLTTLSTGPAYSLEIRDSNGAPCKSAVHAGGTLRTFQSGDVSDKDEFPTMYTGSSPLNIDNHRGIVFVPLATHLAGMHIGHSTFSSSGHGGVSNEIAVEAIANRLVVKDGQSRSANTFVTPSGTDPFASGTYAAQSTAILGWTVAYAAACRMGGGAASDTAIFSMRMNDTAAGRLGIIEMPASDGDTPTHQFVTAAPGGGAGSAMGGFPIMTVPVSTTKFLTVWQPRHNSGSSAGYYGPMGFIGTAGSITTNTAWWAGRTGDALDGAGGRPTLGSVDPQDERAYLDRSTYGAVNYAQMAAGSPDWTACRNLYTDSGVGYNGSAAFLTKAFPVGTLDDTGSSGFTTLSAYTLHTYRYNSATNAMDFVAESNLLPALTAEFGDSFITTSSAGANNQAGHHGVGFIQFVDSARRAAVILWVLDSNTSIGTGTTDGERSSLGYGAGKRIAAWYFPDLIGNPSRHQSLGVIYANPILSCMPVPFAADGYSSIAFVYNTGAVDGTTTTRAYGGVQEIKLTDAIANAAAAMNGAGNNIWLAPRRNR